MSDDVDTLKEDREERIAYLVSCYYHEYGIDEVKRLLDELRGDLSAVDITERTHGHSYAAK